MIHSNNTTNLKFIMVNVFSYCRIHSYYSSFRCNYGYRFWVEYFGYENWNIPRERNNKVDRPKMSNNLPSNNKREKYFAEKYCNIHKELRVMIEECFYLT